MHKTTQVPKMQVQLYNTASRKKEVFEPLDGKEAKIYCCGPTVYHYAHIGNLRTFIFEDLLKRSLLYHGIAVNHVVNITDVGHLTSDEDHGEDKMEKGAKRTGKTVWEIAEYYTEKFMIDCKHLNIIEPTTWCKATDHIAQQIALTQQLEEKGFTYQIEDGVYFDSQKFERYADFGKIDIDGLQEGARIEIGDKKFLTDFALWKLSPTDSKRAMEWDSPWGVGFPGWHLECSAMAMHYLGETLDIHCGGSDLVKVHHTNEIAQSECATGKTFSRFWMHGEFLKMGNDKKMSKSDDEFLKLELLIEKGYSPLDYRYMALTSHYRNFLTFSWEGLDSAHNAVKSLKKKLDPIVGTPGKIESDVAKKWHTTFGEAIADDLNVPKALGILNSMLKDSDLANPEKAALALDFDKVFALDLHLVTEEKADTDGVDVAAIEALIVERKQARTDKNWGRGDEIRDELLAIGIVLKDSKDGTTWAKQ